jgi:hypothetical protein
LRRKCFERHIRCCSSQFRHGTGISTNGIDLEVSGTIHTHAAVGFENLNRRCSRESQRRCLYRGTSDCSRHDDTTGRGVEHLHPCANGCVGSRNCQTGMIDGEGKAISRGCHSALGPNEFLRSPIRNALKAETLGISSCPSDINRSCSVQGDNRPMFSGFRNATLAPNGNRGKARR